MKAVIIVEPEIPENTGFIARLAENYSYQIRIVNPGFNLSKARKTASNGQKKLREVRIYDTVEEAVEGLDYVVGTKPGKGVSASKFTPRDNTSIMIGRESSGLSNSELELCDAVVHIDTPGYDSLNQSHATAVIMNELSASEEKGLSQEKKDYLESLIDSPVLSEIVLRANPSDTEADRLINEVRKLVD